MTNTSLRKVPSWRMSNCRRLVAVFLGAAYFFGGDTKAASVGVGSGLPLSTVARLTQVAADQDWREHVRGQQHLADAEHAGYHPDRRLRAGGLSLDPSTKCMEGQSFTVYSRQRPDLNGCYSESGIGRTAVGQYCYLLFGNATTEIATDTPAVVALKLPIIPQRKHWVLGTAMEPDPRDNAFYCMTQEIADRSHHPADGVWACKFARSKTGAVAPQAHEFHVSCGCAGGPRTKYDKMALVQAGERKNGEPVEKVPKIDTQNPAYSLAKDISIGICMVLFACGVAVAVRIEETQQANRDRRLQSLVCDQAGEAGVELVEHISQTLPSHSAGRLVLETEQ